MKIALYGATGLIGSRVEAEAERRGHHVTPLHRGVPRGDATDLDSVRDVAAAHDAIVSAIAPSRDDPDAFTAVVRGLAGAAESTRLVVVGAAGSLFAAPGVRLFETPGFPEIIRPSSLAHFRSLEFLGASGPGLDWTYVSPAPLIEPGERTGSYHVAADEPAGERISAEDYAVALVDELERPAHRRERLTVAN